MSDLLQLITERASLPYFWRNRNDVDDRPSIQRCLDNCGECYLGNRTYYTSDTIDMPPGSSLIGSGATIISRLTRPAHWQDSQVSDNAHPVIGPGALVKGIIFRSLTDSPNRPFGAAGPFLFNYDRGASIEDCDITYFNRGQYGGKELFLFTVRATVGGAIRRCRIINPKRDGMPENTRQEITAFLLDGPWDGMGVGGAIEDCMIYGAQNGPWHGFTVARKRGAAILRNVIDGLDGVGVWQQSFTTEDLLIDSNRFYNLNNGVIFRSSVNGRFIRPVVRSNVLHLVQTRDHTVAGVMMFAETNQMGVEMAVLDYNTIISEHPAACGIVEMGNHRCEAYRNRFQIPNADNRFVKS